MKKILFLSLFLCFSAFLSYSGQISTNLANKIVDSIYKLEGGPKTKYPFGIKSINTSGNYDKARQICLNTVNNHWKRWESWGKTNCFLDSLADRYCPTQDDKTGNKNWKKNIHLMVDFCKNKK